MNNLLIPFCLLSLFLIIGLIGVYISLRSPSILKMRKKSNRCTKETKFVWQKKYKSKTLCKLSEVEKVERIGGMFNVLHLKLRQGNDVTVFFRPRGRLCSDVYKAEFIQMENEINDFLKNDDSEYIIKYSLLDLGVMLVGGSFFFLLFFGFVIFYSG